MSAPVFQRGNYSDLFGANMLPVLEELFMSELDRHPSRREALFKMVSHDRDIWQSTEIHDMPLPSQLAEGEAYSFNRQKQGASKTLTPVKYGIGFSISEEAVDDGKWDFIADAARKMAKSCKESQEINAMNVFNNGFTSETTADGVAVFSTAHTLPSGGTFSNRAASDADLSVTSLEQALVDFEVNQVGDSGIINLVQPKKILVHPTFKRLAKELIGSDLKADTVEAAGGTGITNLNNMNSFKEEGLSIMSSPHLTDVDSWFMLADQSETGLRVIVRKAIETIAGGKDSGYLNDSILYKARYREDIGVTHAYGAYGVLGA